MNRKSLSLWLRRNRFASKQLAALQMQRKGSYLHHSGWFESFQFSVPLGENKRALPWFTYPSIRFLEPRLNRQLSVFEFGSGNSTFWWAQRVELVVSCEHDRSWYERIKNKMPTNVSYLHRPLAENNYSTACLEQNRSYDIVVIDGRERVKSAENALAVLADHGVLIWDNSERDKYKLGISHLHDQGFKQLDFWGLGPINTTEWCTSIFYRQNNCLEI